MNIKNKVTGIAAAGAMFAAMATPAFAATEVSINGNGGGSFNGVHVVQTNTDVVTQTNVTTITNKVKTSQNTGANSASGNTGGDNSVTSGNATANVTVVNEGGGNVNNGDDCGCPEGDVDVEVKDNGRHSFNHVGVHVFDTKYVGQTNVNDFFNKVKTRQNTGWNKAGWNTRGDNSVTSGHARTTVSVGNLGGGNQN